MLDRYDRAILATLVDDGRATQNKLGTDANLSGTAAGRRQRALEENGIIRGYRAELDLARLGYGSVVIVLIRLERQVNHSMSAFEAVIITCPSVLSCYLLSGGEDYLVTLRARDLNDFERIHRTELSELPGVARIQSLFSLREVIARPVPPALLTS